MRNWPCPPFLIEEELLLDMEHDVISNREGVSDGVRDGEFGLDFLLEGPEEWPFCELKNSKFKDVEDEGLGICKLLPLTVRILLVEAVLLSAGFNGVILWKDDNVVKFVADEEDLILPLKELSEVSRALNKRALLLYFCWFCWKYSFKLLNDGAVW